MVTISTAQARQYAIAAGFSGNAAATIVAIAQAESTLNTNAKAVNGDGSIDRGVLQINSRWHAEITDACAYDAACAFRAAYQISSRGSNFTPWTTFTGGAYLRYMSTVSGSKDNSSGTKKWWQWPISHGYYSKYDASIPDTPHYALDLAVPYGTPLSFPESGTIKKADYQAWGGEIFEDPGAPGGPQLYFYHADRIDVKVGQAVAAGQTVGISGGQTSGGLHPNSPDESTGPHVHFGIFDNYVQTPIGDRPYGPDPSSVLAEFNGISTPGGNDGGLGSTTPGGSTGGGGGNTDAPEPIGDQVNGILSNMPGFEGLARALDTAAQFPGVIWYNPGTSVNLVPGGWAGDVVNATATAVFDPGNYLGAAFRSILDTVVSNLIPLLFRGIMVLIGLLLIGSLIWKAIDGAGLIQAAAESGAV
jgi:murein DD-endopeptidase MepM/ murein hydrolase activator NlpD